MILLIFQSSIEDILEMAYENKEKVFNKSMLVEILRILFGQLVALKYAHIIRTRVVKICEA